MPKRKHVKSSGLGLLFEYETPKIVQISSQRIGVINKLIQLFIIGYIIGWVMIYKKGYQDTDAIVSGVTVKVKGVSETNLTDVPSIGSRVWDVADYVVPPQENSAFFITTNVVRSPGQTQGICSEDPGVYGSKCMTDADCPAGEPIMIGNGVRTGRCVDTNRTKKHRVCEVRAWCPTEWDTFPIPDKPLLPNSLNYTILIKNSIEFPKFRKKKRNILNWFTKKFLYGCRYQPGHTEFKFCPIFKVSTIVNVCTKNINRLLLYGGVIAINIKWDCNLDWSLDYCNPKYSFRRLDDEYAKIAKGWNFRYGQYYSVNGTQYRDLYKAYGIRFLVFVTGKAGKFNIIPFTMNLGSGLALMGMASIICDMLVLNCNRKKKLYKKAKFETVDDSNLPKKKKKNKKKQTPTPDSNGEMEMEVVSQ